MAPKKIIKDNAYFDKKYYTRNNFFEVLTKGGYVKSNNKAHVGVTVKWKIPFMLSYLEKKKGALLDIGCGMCYFLRAVPKGFGCYGVDVSKYAITESKKQNKKFSLKVADITKKIPFSKKFDVITAFDTMEHIEKLDDCFANVKKALAKDGLFFMEVPIKTKFHLFISLFGLGLLHNDPTHIHKEDIEWWIKKAKKYFEIVDAKKVLFENVAVPGLAISGLLVLKAKK
ncbi:MAG: class I SAM-dependent methyltransferase [Candidatus Diapherotrites archaeon]|nr:class I SAM-dependent methyltransferase [Candidatus Diapherotrites archaeon]MBT4596531.1 class I SAM-dependent methyltransferase [Candidatus Diapherotrites archaeon]